jgi:hypothetical protein
MVPTRKPRLVISGINFSMNVVFPDPELPTMETIGGFVISFPASDKRVLFYLSAYTILAFKCISVDLILPQIALQDIFLSHKENMPND